MLHRHAAYNCHNLIKDDKFWERGMVLVLIMGAFGITDLYSSLSEFITAILTVIFLARRHVIAR